MRIARGPRPWPIHAFAMFVLGAAIVGLTNGLMRIDDYNFLPFNPYTGESLSRDEKIIVVSAEFTIVCIPLVAIWVFGSRIARWVLAAFMVLGIVSWISIADSRYWAYVAEAGPTVIIAQLPKLVVWIAVALLFLPSSHRWLNQQRKMEVDPETFA